uniref:Sodium-dependent multivitamin transporter n=1 Tax=Strigamia maritima TaxID=126957 RepID=T1J8R9_STRMM
FIKLNVLFCTRRWRRNAITSCKIQKKVLNNTKYQGSKTTLKMSFHLFDYLILGNMFLISFIIGMYYAYVGRQVKSTKEYFTANGNIGVIPATISLLASILCSIWYVGIPLEVYSYGFHYMMDVPVIVVSLLLCGFAFMPVFYDLQVTSATEYLEKRFNKSIRLLGAFLYLINSAFYVSLVMFIPAMAISQVMNINIWISILSMCIVGTVYTALGGIRAVMWTDVFQTLIIYSSLLAIAIKGTIDVGGLGVVRDRGVKGKRIAVAPALFINIPALIFVDVLIIYIGLVLYATFAGCDPFLNNKISFGDEVNWKFT